MKAFPHRRVRVRALHPLAAAVIAFLPAWSGLSAHAQSTSAPAATRLPPVVVTANPLGNQELIAPATSLDGQGLVLRSRSTLGQTLDGLPGVAGSWFGPNASRPTIRGLDGDRVRILDNSGASVDASGISYDHAVPVDPIGIDRIEVLRGPGTLLYGGNAVGGVVNLIDNRIPREPLFGAAGGVGGRVDLSLTSVNRERAGALMLETGNDRFGLHVDAFNRDARDTAVPATLACTNPASPASAQRICNSAAQTRGGALGAAVYFQGGYLGLSAATFRSDYGTVAEDEVTIGMRSDRYALEGLWRNPGGLLREIKGRFGHADYRHTEFEAGAPGTVFSSSGNDLRLEARHAPIGPLEGVIGIQAEATRFAADGAEAFAPYSRTRQSAVFVHEEWRMGTARLSAGARVESVQVTSFGNPVVARFAPARREFQPRSYATGVLIDLTPGWQLSGNLAWSERAPKDYELFADGPHVATAAYEVGSPAFGKERSTNMDLGVQWRQGAHRFSVNAFVNRFRNYLALDATGITRDTDGNGAGVGVTDDGFGNSVESGGTAEILPEFAYSQVRARFTGLEPSARMRLLDSGGTVDLELRADLVRARNLGNGQPLARIAPARLGASLLWQQGPWGASLSVMHHAAQNRVPAGQLATSAYTLTGASLTWRQKAGAGSLLWYAQLDNLGNVLAYPASSILTQAAPGKSPLAGRSLRLGLQATF